MSDESGSAPSEPGQATRKLDLVSNRLSGHPVELIPDLEGRGGFGPVLRNGPFLRLWIAQASSQTFQNVVWWALFLQIAHLTNGAPAGIGVAILMVQVPTILFAGLSGVLVDRFSKQAILIFSNLVRAGGCLGYVLLQDHLAALYVITLAVSVVNQPFQPAESATIPLVVSKRDLLAANALFQITFLCAGVAGYSLGPLLVALPFVGISRTWMISGAFLAFAALILIPLPAITRERRQSTSATAREAALQMLVELIEVARVVIRDRPLTAALVQLSLGPAVLLVLSELGPKFVQQLLNTGQANAMIILVAPAGAGLGLGLFLIDRVGHIMPKGRVASAALLVIGLAIAALAVVPNVVAALLSNVHLGRTLVASCMTVPISFVLGIGTALLNAPAQTIVQERADVNLRGRVFAVQQALAAGVTIPPLVAVAAVGQLLTVPQTLGILAAVVILAALASRRAYT
jgi:MFS family permease